MKEGGREEREERKRPVFFPKPPFASRPLSSRQRRSSLSPPSSSLPLSFSQTITIETRSPLLYHQPMSSEVQTSPKVPDGPHFHRNIPSISTFHSQEIPPQQKDHHHHVETGVNNATVDEFEKNQVGEEVVAGVNLAEVFKVEQGGWHGYVEWEKKSEKEKCEKAKAVLL